jgi:hypothetical protein
MPGGELLQIRLQCLYPPHGDRVSILEIAEDVLLFGFYLLGDADQLRSEGDDRSVTFSDLILQVRRAPTQFDLFLAKR